TAAIAWSFTKRPPPARGKCCEPGAWPSPCGLWLCRRHVRARASVRLKWADDHTLVVETSGMDERSWLDLVGRLRSPSVVELRIDHFAGDFCPKNRQHWLCEEPDLLENRSLVPIDVLVRELALSESHDGNQRNFNAAIGGRNAGQHPRNFLCVREREDHLINKLVPADGA